MQKINREQLPDGKIEYTVDKNPYESLAVDITNRCNMTCNFCYNPVRSTQDMSLDYFEYVCANLPFPVLLKLCGGEPTLHPNLVDLIHIAHVYKHRVHIVSNGTRFSDHIFMNSLKELKRTGTPFSLSLSMDGGYANKHAYEVINGRDCLEQKLDAFDSLISYKLGRVGLTAIIVRGLNEDVIPQLISLAERNTVVRYLHFRNAGKVGIWIDTKPYSIEELRGLVRCNFSEDEFKMKCVQEPHCPPESGNECCFRFRPTNRLQISLIEFNSERSSKCQKRGRLAIGSDNIQPLFESMKQDLTR
jgi:molybdenum cofactor biosynthesis enzyme MoaA